MRVPLKLLRGVTWDSACEGPDPSSLHISEPEDAWCGASNWAPTGWISGIRGQRKSTKGTKEKLKPGRPRLWFSLSSLTTCDVAFLQGDSIFHISTNKEMDTECTPPPPTPPPKVMCPFSKYMGKDLWSLACWTRTWCNYLYILSK